jgi:plastocyanin
MKIVYSIFGALFCSLFWVNFSPVDSTPNSSLSSILQTATIEGIVTLPPTSGNAQRRFRGSAYRSRGNSSSASSSNTQENQFENTIVSMHPLSYTIDDLPTQNDVQIVQKDAVFIPNVTPVTVGSTVQFVNDDPFYHNVFSLTPGSKFNIGRRPTGDVYSKEVSPPRWKVSGLGPINLFCDIHTQMNAIILGLDTPYFTRVNEDGTYSISDIPPGTYELRAFNRNTELFQQKITVAADETYSVNINMAN